MLPGQGDGTFETTTPISLGTLEPSSLVAGDFTGDGRADLAVAGDDSSSGQGEVEVLLGKGDGTFQAPTPINLGNLAPPPSSRATSPATAGPTSPWPDDRFRATGGGAAGQW